MRIAQASWRVWHGGGEKRGSIMDDRWHGGIGGKAGGGGETSTT